MNRIVKDVGIELEGGVPRSRVHNYYDVKNKIKRFIDKPNRHIDDTDGTVNMYEEPIIYTMGEWKYYGSIKQVSKWLGVFFNKLDYKANCTCGFHLHIKLRRGLSDSENRKLWIDFRKEYMNKYGDNEKYMARMERDWCLFSPKPTVTCGSKHYAMNLIPDEFGTIEVRVFPYQESLAEAKDTVRWCVSTINKIFS